MTTGTGTPDPAPPPRLPARAGRWESVRRVTRASPTGRNPGGSCAAPASHWPGGTGSSSCCCSPSSSAPWSGTSTCGSSRSAAGATPPRRSRWRTAGSWCLPVVEVLRQIHFLISERCAGVPPVLDASGSSAAANRWTQRRFSAWTRFRLGRAINWLVLDRGHRGRRSARSRQLADHRAVQGAGPADRGAAVHRSGRLPSLHRGHASSSRSSGSCPGAASTPTTPTTSRPGSPTSGARTTCSPGSRRTSSSSRTRRRSRARAATYPCGILLWGPPGTGKTLMAEAVAGETGKPYVFVDPGAFINMFMGVGILKVKAPVPQAAQARAALRRRDRVLRRGRRARQPRRRARRRQPAGRHARRRSTTHGCNGFALPVRGHASRCWPAGADAAPTARQRSTRSGDRGS